MAQGIGGGTRIGESLATFNRWHARRVINSRTAVVIVSDGYDTGEPERLAEEMRRLRQRCRRVIWLNPLIGWRDYLGGGNVCLVEWPERAESLLPEPDIAIIIDIQNGQRRVRMTALHANAEALLDAVT